MRYLLARDAGSAVGAESLRSFTTGFSNVVDLTVTDVGRCAELVEQYSDLPPEATDASRVALAQRLEITELATLDRRHFSIVRPNHVDSHSLIP
jgi:predicted nucleic acid-binding protein